MRDNSSQCGIADYAVAWLPHSVLAGLEGSYPANHFVVAGSLGCSRLLDATFERYTLRKEHPPAFLKACSRAIGGAG